MKQRLGFIMLLAVATLWLTGCGSMVEPGEAGLRWRPVTFGLSEEPLREGFYWHLPWNDVHTISVQWKTFKERIDVLTQDDLHIRVDASVVARPLVKEIYQLALEIGPDFYERIIKPEFLTVVRSTMAEYIMVEIPEKSQIIEARTLKLLRERIKGKHLALDNVTINHIDFTAGMLRAIEAKLTKEQEKIQKDFELAIAIKDAAIAREKAKGEGDALEIMARAEAEAQKIRAGGQAEAQKIIDQTLTTRFLQFKAFDNPNAKFIFIPTGQEGLPIILSPEIK